MMFRSLLLAGWVMLLSGAVHAQGLQISSPDFENNGYLDPRFTCQGQDVSPALFINYIPDAAKSLVLIVDDPDAPHGTWDHWIVYDIDPSTALIEEGRVPGTQGWNDFGKAAWGGPCPPGEVHRYVFRLYALDRKLNAKPDLLRSDLEQAMEGYIIDQAELIGLYKRF